MPRRAFIAPDGAAYHVGVRWFWRGEYHRAPPPDGRGTRYRLFYPVAGGEWYRLVAIDADAPAQVDEATLTAQFRKAGVATTRAPDPPEADPR